MAVKKKGFDIEIPLVNTSVRLNALEIENLNKKTLKLDLTRQLHGRSIEAVFIINVKDGKISADIRSIRLLPFYIQRAMRKGVSYVEDSFTVEKEGRILRLKPYMITRKEVHRSVRKALREKAKEEIRSFVGSKSIEEIFTAVAYGRYQKELSLKLKKVYPLAFCEIRVLELLKEKD